MMSLSRTRSDSGAVAVVVAICSILVFSLAALAVDLGNAMVRKRDVQSQADFAALAGAAELGQSNGKSASDPAVIAVARYLTENQPQDDKAGPHPAITPDQLVDELTAPYPDWINNGEVFFLSGHRLRVVAPDAHVNFGLAGVMGFDSTDVQAEATVGIRTPGAALPFFLPRDCLVGPVTLKDSSHDPKVDTFSPAASNGAGVASIASVDPLSVPGGITSTLKLFGKDFSSTMTVDFFQASSGDRIPTDVATGHAASLTIDTIKDDEAATELPAGVFNRPGTWYVRVNNGSGYSKSTATFTVGNPTPPPVTCGQRSTGDFGALDSPRKLVNQLADATALNMAEGLDHDLAPFDPALLPTPKQDTCNGLGGTPPYGAQNDTDPHVDGNNCVDVKNGMNTDTVTRGIITGGSTAEGPFDGLLHEDTLDGCDRTGGSAEKDRLGYNTNDDVLSCFLEADITVGQVTGSTIGTDAEHSISSRIFQSPRFAVVPVIDYPINPQNGFYPVVSFQPIFITDEPPASENGASFASSTNGVTLSGGKVVALTVMPINPLALPKVADTSGATTPWNGVGTKVVRLLN